MADSNETIEVTAIKSRINSWLDQHHNRIEIDLQNRSINFNQHSGNLFTGNDGQVAITLGFTDENLTKNSSLDQFRQNFNFIALDRLPCPGLDGIPSQWEIYPQTPISSFSEGVTIEQYDPSTQILQLNIKTGFFAIYGRVPQQVMIADAPSPKGTYLQVRRDIQGVIYLRAKLVFN